MSELYSRRSFQTICASVALLRPALAAGNDAITDKLSNWSKHPELKKYAAAFEYLTKADFSKMAPGRVNLDGDNMYATLTANKARLVDSAKFEAHKKYLDIHYLVQGQETIGSAAASSLEGLDPYKADGDIEFFKVPAKYRKIELKPGHFAIFLPGQAHLPGVGTDTSAVIRKVVVKVRV